MTGEVEYDMHGPPKAPLRMAVHVADYLDKVSSVSKSKKLLVDTGVNKKATDGDIMKMAKSLTVGHESIGAGVWGDSSSMLQQVSKGSSSGGDVFTGVQVGLAKVTELCPLSEEESEEEEGEKKKKEDRSTDKDGNDDDDDDNHNDGDDKDAGAGGKSKGSTWFDRDRTVNITCKQLLGVLDKQKSVAQKYRTELASQIQIIEGMRAEDHAKVRGEEMLARSRLQALQLLFGSEKALQAHLKSYDRSASASASSRCGDPESKMLGHAPPSKLYAQLRTFDTWHDAIQKLEACQTREDVEGVKEECKSLKGPIADLCGACKTILSDCTKAAKALQTAKGNASKLKSAGNKNSQASKGIFNFFQKCLPMVRKVEGSDLLDVNLAKPFVIRCDSLSHANLEKDELVKGFLFKDFLVQFQAQSAVDALSRAGRKLPAEVAAKMQDRIREILPWAGPVCEDDALYTQLSPAQQGLMKSMTESLAIISGAGTVTTGRERGFSGLCADKS